MKPRFLLLPLCFLPAALAALPPAPLVPHTPTEELRETRPLLMSTPNSRGERGVLLVAPPYSELGTIFGLLRADGTLLPARGGMNKLVSPGFEPDSLCWAGDDCLVAYAASTHPMPPHAARKVGGTYFPVLRSRLCIVELHGDCPAPSQGQPGVRCEEHTRLDLPPDLQASLEGGQLHLRDKEGRDVLRLDLRALPTADSPRRPLPHPDCREGVADAARAMQGYAFRSEEETGFGPEVAGVSSANGRGERIVSLMAGGARFRKGNYPLALLTKEGRLHPLGGDDLCARSESMLPPNGFTWLDDDTFLFRAGGATYELVEVWKLAADRRPKAQEGDPMPRIGVERVLKGQFGRGRDLKAEPGRLHILLGEPAEPVGAVRW